MSSSLLDHCVSLVSKLRDCKSVIVSVIAVYMYMKYTSRRKPSMLRAAQEPLIEDAIFFTNMSCDHHEDFNSTCVSGECGLLKLKKILSYLEKAETSIDVCVYTITNYKLAEVILRKFNEGVRVRVITDEGSAFGDGSQVPEFRKKGVLVRAEKNVFLMHHKFAIIDKRILINGSLNWTVQATNGNYENVTITSSRKLIHKYSQQFEELWKKMSS